MLEKKEEVLVSYPNPVGNSITLQVNTKLKGKIAVPFISETGRIQKTFSLKKLLISNRSSVKLTIKKQYVVMVSMNGWRESKKIIKL